MQREIEVRTEHARARMCAKPKTRPAAALHARRSRTSIDTHTSLLRVHASLISTDTESDEKSKGESAYLCDYGFTGALTPQLYDYAADLRADLDGSSRFQWSMSTSICASCGVIGASKSSSSNMGLTMKLKKPTCLEGPTLGGRHARCVPSCSWPSATSAKHQAVRPRGVRC